MAATPAAAPPNPAGSWRAGRTGLVFASVSDRDRYERVRSDGDRSGGEDRSDGVRSGGGPHYAHSEGGGLEASGHVQSYRRVSFADQREEQGSPGRGPLERATPAAAGGAGGAQGRCAPSFFGLEDQGLSCTPAPRSGGTLNPTRSLSRSLPGDIGARPEEWDSGSVRPMPVFGGPEGGALLPAAPTTPSKGGAVPLGTLPGAGEAEASQMSVARRLSDSWQDSASWTALCAALEPHQQKETKQLDAARKLLRCLPERMTEVGSRPPGDLRSESEVGAAMLRVLMARGSSANDDSRTMIRNMAEWRRTRDLSSKARGFEASEPELLFPVSIQDLESFKAWMEAQGKMATCATKLADTVSGLRLLGLPVPQEDDRLYAALRRRTTQVPAGAPRPNARQALPPLLVLELEYMAEFGFAPSDQAQLDEQGAQRPPPRTASGELCPQQVYAIAELVQIKTTDRGDGVWSASYDAGMAPPGCGRYVTAIDKEQRTKVEQFFPLGGFGMDSTPNVDRFIKSMDGRPVMPMYLSEAGGCVSLARASKWAGDGKVTAAPFSTEAVGKRALAEVSALASGLTLTELKARKLSGTHADRHVGPEMAGECSWPSEDIDALGGWAPPPADASGGRPERRAKKAPQSRSVIYRPRAEVSKVVAVRSRFVEAARAFIRRFGADNLTYETTWADLVPSVCPDDDEHGSYAKFYGPRHPA